jgi:1,4-alpha-glucan branching enzyme
MAHLWYELNNRRQDEKTISYAESHDQALVGDKTLIFRLIDSDMYDCMNIGCENLRVDRGLALHKLIRFITLSTADSGYLNFMGNEFGHPEWIDFPRNGNNWSLKYARRQWHLLDNTNLKYRFLADFDKDMISLAKGFKVLESPDANLLYEHNDDKLIVFGRGGLIFVFNFHPVRSYTDYCFEAPPGEYRIIFNSDAPEYGGHSRLLPDQHHLTLHDTSRGYGRDILSLYIPNRTAFVLQRVE